LRSGARGWRIRARVATLPSRLNEDQTHVRTVARTSKPVLHLAHCRQLRICPDGAGLCRGAGTRRTSEPGRQSAAAISAAQFVTSRWLDLAARRGRDCDYLVAVEHGLRLAAAHLEKNAACGDNFGVQSS